MNFIGLIKPLLVFVILGLSASAAQADMRFVEGNKTILNIAQWPHLEISGNISSADADRLPRLLVTATLSSKVQVAGSLAPLVMLNSLGGNVEAAMKIGRMLRSASANTVVGMNAECSSACVLILAAGAHRLVLTDGRGIAQAVF
jgi:hypothetical protein